MTFLKSPYGKILAVLTIVSLVAFVAYVYQRVPSMPTEGLVTALPLVSEETDVSEPEAETMSLVLYLQDKEIARVSDCGATRRVVYTVPYTEGVADLSLRMLFEDELAQYAGYKSVRVIDGVAEVMLEGDRQVIGSLSSCQAGHLMNVLTDTLTQYDTITSVELYTSEGRVEF
ncbi:MAG: hypothetical protein Q8K68_06850 [Nitrospirota bacterium]|nr:hypothetical protein [Nitrospirota bacterium]